MTVRRLVGFAALAGLAGLLLTWPCGHQAAALGVAFVVGTAVLFLLERRRLALLPLAALAVATMFLPGALTTWQAWTAPWLFVAVLDALLPNYGDPGAAWKRTGGLLAGLLALAVLAWLWRPTRASLVGEEGVLIAVGLIAAIAMAIVLWSTAEDEEELIAGRRRSRGRG